MSIYLHIPAIKGSVHNKGYEGWIALQDVEFNGLHNPIDMTVGSAIKRFSTRPSFGQLALIKALDDSSIHLFQAVHSAQVYPTLDIHYVTSGDEPVTYAKTTLTNAALTHYAERFSPTFDEPQEIIHMAYTQIQRAFIPRDSNNRTGSPMITGYDLETASAM